jgi:protein-tyrosine phosphatase
METTNNNLTGYEAPDYGVEEIEPTWSEILPGLWQGGTSRSDDFGDVKYDKSTSDVTSKHFDFVATLYAWAKPVDWFVREFRYGVYDSNIEHLDMGGITELVNMVHREWKSGSRVLVRCQMGWNRSGLVTALVLMKEGYSAEEAINLLRTKRSKWALCNREFEAFLLGLQN